MPPTTKSKKLGELVRKQRDRKGFSINGLANAAKGQDPTLKIDPAYLLRLERGEYRQPSVAILEALSRFLDIPIDRLYDLAEYPIPRLDLKVYLREQGWPRAGIDEMAEVYDLLQTKYGVDVTKKGGRRGKRSP